MTPPVYIGEGLVVEGEAAEEYLGALSSFIFTTDTIPLGFIVVRRILARLLNLSDECRGGAFDACGERFGDFGCFEAGRVDLVGLFCDLVDFTTKTIQLKLFIGT
ncbi:AMP-dependent synthetase/ligase [Babesia caballi]|uniref:AMP-dependent synthetase/ligase n=1 Tax=Babesia caballi TaxID=5871 RepID=A0AAV4LPD6_BABCB|nr:AMP-dependent synthetase/ligase [Babesia caballi]